ncbi:hypothetical protein FZC78_00800 [Rossellomorea vietnamensis]|uniref:Uncharacterized protein n=1 Tax=Rossellomorea vietnamensis TaxID=218284 RepID=A0A5D4P071_9BACI|nr:hypothetical protein [Rossellomorea vietnamensis]TYS19600.1 hypothetical protein FZC78_00800 [Rossellomorea vietnamensis]
MAYQNIKQVSYKVNNKIAKKFTKTALLIEDNLGQVMSFSCFFGRIRTDVLGGDIGIIRKPENRHSYGTMK